METSPSRNPNLRMIFMGSAELACPSLENLAAEPTFRILAVVSQPDKPKGRDLKIQPGPVKELALRLNLPLLQPPKARHPDFVEQLKELAPDLLVVVAYGQILHDTILRLPKFGCVNVHTSLLPRYRGAAPIQWALLNGDPETGVTIMKMDEGLDTGDILAQERTVIEAEDNAKTLHDRLARMGAALLLKTIPGYVQGNILPVKQPEGGSIYARKITKEDGELDWTMPAHLLWNRVRALTPWPGTFTYLNRGQERLLLKIWEANPENFPENSPGVVLEADKRGLIIGCGEGALRISKLQKQGGRKLPVQEFLSGFPIQKGERLGK